MRPGVVSGQGLFPAEPSKHRVKLLCPPTVTEGANAGRAVLDASFVQAEVMSFPTVTIGLVRSRRA